MIVSLRQSLTIYIQKKFAALKQKLMAKFATFRSKLFSLKYYRN